MINHDYELIIQHLTVTSTQVCVGVSPALREEDHSDELDVLRRFTAVGLAGMVVL